MKFGQELRNELKDMGYLDAPITSKVVEYLRLHLRNRLIKDLDKSAVVRFIPSLEREGFTDAGLERHLCVNKKYYNAVVKWCKDNDIKFRLYSNCVDSLHEPTEVLAELSL